MGPVRGQLDVVGIVAWGASRGRSAGLSLEDLAIAALSTDAIHKVAIVAMKSIHVTLVAIGGLPQAEEEVKLPPVKDWREKGPAALSHDDSGAESAKEGTKAGDRDENDDDGLDKIVLGLRHDVGPVGASWFEGRASGCRDSGRVREGSKKRA